MSLATEALPETRLNFCHFPAVFCVCCFGTGGFWGWVKSPKVVLDFFSNSPWFDGVTLVAGLFLWGLGFGKIFKTQGIFKTQKSALLYASANPLYYSRRNYTARILAWRTSPSSLGARGKRRGFSPGAVVHHLQSPRVHAVFFNFLDIFCFPRILGYLSNNFFSERCPM